MGTFHRFLLLLSVLSSVYCYNEEEEEAYLIVKPSISSFVNGSKIENSPDDATTFQRSKDARLFYHDTDDNRDIVHYFDYTVESPDYHAAANDYDSKAVFLADHQQVKTYIYSFLVLYYRTVPYRSTVLI